jgi:hypothetical protein
VTSLKGFGYALISIAEFRDAIPESNFLGYDINKCGYFKKDS